MKLSQKERILEMLEQAPDNTVTCWQLAQEYLYHKAASRIGELEREKGITIEFIKGESVMTGKYHLIKKGGDANAKSLNSQDSMQFKINKSEPELEPACPITFKDGQGVFL